MNLLDRVRRLPLGFRPPASPEALSALSAELGGEIPALLVSWYRDHDGVTNAGPLALRFMSVSEVRELLPAFLIPDWADSPVCPFWTDDNSNYAAVLLSGPLKGRVCLVDHEEPDLTPRYRSLEAFIQVLLDHAGKDVDWHELPTEDSAGNANQAALEEVRRTLSTAPSPARRRRAAFDLIALLRREDLEELSAFARDEDMFVQERACQRIGELKLDGAAGLLEKIARDGSHNGTLASILALGRIGTVDCGDRLARLSETLSDGWGPYLGKALKDCGYEVGHVERKARFRRPGDSEWRPLR